MTELWRCSWPGNPSTKKNSPLPLMFCLCGDGKKRQIGAFLERLRDAATRNGERWDALLVREPSEAGGISDSIGLRLSAGAAAGLCADLEAATGADGRQTIVLPSEDYRKAQRAVVPKLRETFQATGLAPFGGKDQALQIEAHFYLGPKQRPDLLSLCEAVSDLLQEAEVIVNEFLDRLLGRDAAAQGPARQPTHRGRHPRIRSSREQDRPGVGIGPRAF